MAMIDYGAVVKKNGKLLPHEDLFNNYSTLDGGQLHEEYGEEEYNGEKYPVCLVHEYIGDESERLEKDGDEVSKKSVIHNYMAVVGDKEFLIATYKSFIAIYDHEKLIMHYWLGEDDVVGWHINYKLAKILKTPFGDIKIKRFHPGTDRAIASFWYKDDYYEILFGYGIDRKEFIFSKHAKRYFDIKNLRKIRRWFLK